MDEVIGIGESNELFIVKKMIKGDAEAFKYFFETYYTDLCNFVNLYVKDQATSEEIVQDIFIHFWEHKASLSINVSVKSFLYSCSKYRSLNHLRDSRRQEAIKSRFADMYVEDASYDDFDDKKFRELLLKAQEALPPKCLLVFQLSHDRRLSNKEIAQHLGLSIKTVENQMTIAYKKLRAYLQPYKKQIFFLCLASILQ